MDHTDEEIASTAALVGATGGAGTTRLCVEVGGALARNGQRVIVFDAAIATQGLADYVNGSIETDVTALMEAPDVRTRDVAVGYHVAGPGELFLCPARASFQRIASAKTTAAAQRFEPAIRDAGVSFDHVIVDTPPVASNPAVAAVTAVDRVGVVTPATPRGVDALQRTRGRLADVGTAADVVVANRGTDHPVGDADVTIPECDATHPTDAPVSDREGAGAFERAVVVLATELFDTDLPIPEETGLIGGLLDR